MGLFTKLFGTTKRTHNNPYVDAGVRFTKKLVNTLALDGWQDGLPEYTHEEVATIDAGLSGFQQMANEVIGGTAIFHPEMAPLIQRMEIASALEDLAGEGWRFSVKSELPENWKIRVSTYLKAWASGLSPDVLLELAEMLDKAGCKTEAKESYSIVLLFPTYAHTFFGGSANTAEITSSLVRRTQEGLRSIEDKPSAARFA